MNISRKQIGMGIGLILAITVLAYLPAIRGGFIWDDDDYVTSNLSLRSLDGLRRIWSDLSATHQYYPLVHTSFWLEYHLWGLQPLGYHLVNVLLHSTNAVLFLLLLRRLSVSGAFLAAALFAVHPVHVESVAWITERKNVLSGLFYLSAMLAYLRFCFGKGSVHISALPPKAQSDKPFTGATPQSYYALAGLLFLCALLSKTVTCSMPAALLLLLWWKRGRVLWRDVLPLIPFFLVGAALGLTTAWLERHQVGAQGGEWALSFMDRCLIAGRALWFYAGKLLLPYKLAFIYPRWQVNAAVWWQYLFPLAAVAVIVGLWLWRKRTDRGPLVAVLFFAGTLVPALGFFDVYPMRFSFVADHFQYLASLGLIALFAAVVESIIHGLGEQGRRIGYMGCALLLATQCILVWRQGYIYRDMETLFRDTIEKNPSCLMAHQNLGSILLNQGKVDEAVAHFSEALKIKPNDAGVYNNLGLARAQQGKFDEAISYYSEALRLEPNHNDALNNLAWLRATHGETRFRNATEAVSMAERACALSLNKNPMYLDTLAAAYAEAGRFSHAVQTAEKAFELAQSLGQTEVATEVRNRLKLYRSGLPFHEGSNAGK